MSNMYKVTVILEVEVEGEDKDAAEENAMDYIDDSWSENITKLTVRKLVEA